MYTDWIHVHIQNFTFSIYSIIFAREKTHVKLRCNKEPRSTSLSCSVRIKSIVPSDMWEDNDEFSIRRELLLHISRDESSPLSPKAPHSISMMTCSSPCLSPSQWCTRSARSRNAAFDPVPKIIPIRVAGSIRAPSTFIFFFEKKRVTLSPRKWASVKRNRKKIEKVVRFFLPLIFALHERKSKDFCEFEFQITNVPVVSFRMQRISMFFIPFFCNADWSNCTTSQLTTEGQLNDFVHVTSSAEFSECCLIGNENVNPIGIVMSIGIPFSCMKSLTHWAR